MKTIEGVVERGSQLGRKLGFPTANLRVPAEEDLPDGVYAAWLVRLDGTVHPGAASLGVRPTVAATGERLLEVHVLDCAEWLELYGERVTIRLTEMLRPEVRFESIEALIDQIRIDCDDVRHVLAGSSGLQDSQDNVGPVG